MDRHAVSPESHAHTRPEGQAARRVSRPVLVVRAVVGVVESKPSPVQGNSCLVAAALLMVGGIGGWGVTRAADDPYRAETEWLRGPAHVVEPRDLSSSCSRPPAGSQARARRSITSGSWSTARKTRLATTGWAIRPACRPPTRPRYRTASCSTYSIGKHDVAGGEAARPMNRRPAVGAVDGAHDPVAEPVDDAPAAGHGG